MIIQRRIILILLSLILGVYGCFSFAVTQPSIGTVISVEGSASAINQENQKRPLQRRSSIYLHDRIVTQQESKVQLILQDDSVVVVQAASEFYVSDFSFNKSAPRNNKYVGNIVKGALINMSGRGETKNYHLNSPLVTIAFRGTGLATKLITRNMIPIDQEIHVFQGYVTVSNRCENIAACVPTRMDIGVGQKVNAASVSMLGVVQGYKSSGILGKEAAISTDKTITKPDDTGGGVSIKCKGSR